MTNRSRAINRQVNSACRSAYKITDKAAIHIHKRGEWHAVSFTRYFYSGGM